MKNSFILLALLAIGFSIPSYSQPKLALLPYPNSVKESGQKIAYQCFNLKGTEIFTSVNQLLRDGIKKEGIRIDHTGIPIVFKQNDRIPKEGYELTIDSSQVQITYSVPTGAYYGSQTFLQLLRQESSERKLPIIEIKDEPAFSWRALMLDESRYFKGKEVVKELLDKMAALKMNVFHWHLTDDQGWRIEIKKYPELTRIGGIRKNTQIGGYDSKQYDEHPHAGFYTQKEVQEIIQYAADRQIMIVPEIEMPGHASAAIAAYPWLGTSKKQIDVPGKFGVHYEIYNVADPKVVGFLEDVLTEIAALFPGNVIHVGGDEVKYDQWKEDEGIKKYMEQRNLKAYKDVQISFINDISAFLQKRNKRMMGWNEIMGAEIHDWQTADKVEASSKLQQNTIVHFWKGDSKLINDAITKGYDVVNSTHNFTYLDYNYESIPLTKAYGFNPVPEGVNEAGKKHIIGLGCQMWAEWIPTVQKMNSQIFPRAAAYAETGWTKQENKDFNRFEMALKVLEIR